MLIHKLILILYSNYTQIYRLIMILFLLLILLLILYRPQHTVNQIVNGGVVVKANY